MFFKSCGGTSYIKNKIDAVYDVKCVIHPMEEAIYIHGPPEGKLNATKRLLAYAEHLINPVSINSPLAGQPKYQP